jgi:hypothetical protein
MIDVLARHVVGDLADVMWLLGRDLITIRSRTSAKTPVMLAYTATSALSKAVIPQIIMPLFDSTR